MKKKGFTLAEVLIAVGIIGVMSAIMASAFNQAKPDKTKMMYLKAYDSLSEAISIMANDSTLFSTSIHVGSGEDDNVNIEIAPLFDTAQPTNSYYYNIPNLNDAKKFGRVLALMFKVNNPTTEQGNITFRTGPSEMNWTVYPMQMSPGTINMQTTQVRACFRIDLRIGGENDGQNFQFCVQPDGGIRAVDATGVRYLANRRNVRSRNDEPLQNFVSAPCNTNNSTPFFIVNGVMTDEQPPQNP